MRLQIGPGHPVCVTSSRGVHGIKKTGEIAARQYALSQFVHTLARSRLINIHILESPLVMCRR
jgi:hypothetical protein